MKGSKQIAAVLLTAALLTGCAESSALSDIKSDGTVYIATEKDDALLNELSAEIAGALGADAQYIYTDKENALELVSNGEAHAAVCYFPKSDALGLDYSTTYPFYSENIYAVCLSSRVITSASELSGKILGADTTLSDSLLRRLAVLSADGALYSKDPLQAAEMLRSGDLDVFFCLESTAAELVSADSSLRCYIPSDIEPQQYCVAVLRTETALYAEINGAVGKFVTGGN